MGPYMVETTPLELLGNFVFVVVCLMFWGCLLIVDKIQQRRNKK